MAATATKPAKRGRPATWTSKKSMVAAGVEWVKHTGKRPTIEAFSKRNTTEVNRPSSATILNSPWFDKWADYVKAVGAAYKRETGNAMPEPNKGGRKPAAAKVTNDVATPVKRGPGRPKGSKNKPKAAQTDEAAVPADTDTLTFHEPVKPAKRGFWRSLFQVER